MTDQERIIQLEQQNQELKSQLDKALQGKNRKKQRFGWLLRKASTPLIGSKLKKSISNAINEYKADKKVSVDTVSDVSANVIWRFTRIGAFTFLLAVLPALVLIFQTWLLFTQNSLVNSQNHLVSVQESSSRVFLMDNILSDLSDEMRRSSDGKISAVLETRIANLSRTMKPYKYVVDGKVLGEKISPERGQFLYSLIKSNLSDRAYRDILRQSDFTYAYLNHLYLGSGVNLKFANLNYANLEGVKMESANLENIELKKANMKAIALPEANLKSANLAQANLEYAELPSADLTYANLREADLRNADLTEAILWGTKLDDADLRDVKLDNVIVGRQDWIAYVADSLDLKGGSYIEDTYKIEVQGKKQFRLIAKK